MIPDANAIGQSSPPKQRHAVRPLVVVVRIRLWFRFREYRGRQMQFILVKRNALPPPRGDQGPSHPTQNVTKALFGLILWRNDGWIPLLLRTLLCLCGEYEMSTHCYVHTLLVCLFSDALTRILRFAIQCPTKVSAALSRNRFSVFSTLRFEI